MNECCPSLLAAPLAETDAEDLAVVFAALSDPVRLRLLSLVADAGLVHGEKRGRWVWWRVVPERLDAVRDALAARPKVRR
jgi:ArsR family transcriptional regulator